VNESLERRVRERAKDRCEYCKIPAYIVDHSIAHDRGVCSSMATEPKETAGFLSPVPGFEQGRDCDLAPA
jgi:hypothetical protein